MKPRNLVVCVASMALLYGCATQNTENSEMTDQANAEPAAQATVKVTTPSTPEPVAQETSNVDKASTPEATPAPMKVAEKEPAKASDGSCTIKGDKVMLGKRPIGISVVLDYCDANLKPEGSKFWIPEDDAPAIGNIRVEDQCNITYCPTTAHYDHFNISDGKNVLQVQVKWENNKPVIF
jgi:hypothetical protein